MSSLDAFDEHGRFCSLAIVEQPAKTAAGTSANIMEMLRETNVLETIAAKLPGSGFCMSDACPAQRLANEMLRDAIKKVSIELELERPFLVNDNKLPASLPCMMHTVSNMEKRACIPLSEETKGISFI